MIGTQETESTQYSKTGDSAVDSGLDLLPTITVAKVCIITGIEKPTMDEEWGQDGKGEGSEPVTGLNVLHSRDSDLFLAFLSAICSNLGISHPDLLQQSLGHIFAASFFQPLKVTHHEVLIHE
jgi:hypothetical protein